MTAPSFDSAAAALPKALGAKCGVLTQLNEIKKLNTSGGAARTKVQATGFYK